MTGLNSWLSPAVMEPIGWALIHSLWQCAALAALAALTMAFIRRPAVRYLVGVGTLAVMLAAPVATFFILMKPAAPVQVLRPVTASVLPAGPALSAPYPVAALAGADRAIGAIAEAPRRFPLPDILPWLVVTWLCGVAVFSLRFAGGFLLLEHRRRTRSHTPGERVLALCRELQRQLGLDRAIQYLECGWVETPAVIGWLRPAVLLPVFALTGLSEEQVRAVIAHELAHIRRHDWFVNLFQVLVESLLFYHPAMWWLNRRIRVERELCCDEIAVSLTGSRLEYARALAQMAEWKNVSMLAMAANRGPLSQRILHILGRPGAGPRVAGLTGGALFLTAALAAANLLFGIAYPIPAAHAKAEIKAVLVSSRSAALHIAHQVLQVPEPVKAPQITAPGQTEAASDSPLAVPSPDLSRLLPNQSLGTPTVLASNAPSSVQAPADDAAPNGQAKVIHCGNTSVFGRVLSANAVEMQGFYCVLSGTIGDNSSAIQSGSCPLASTYSYPGDPAGPFARDPSRTYLGDMVGRLNRLKESKCEFDIQMNVRLADPSDAARMQPGKMVRLAGEFLITRQNGTDYLSVTNARVTWADPFNRQVGANDPPKIFHCLNTSVFGRAVSPDLLEMEGFACSLNSPPIMFGACPWASSYSYPGDPSATNVGNPSRANISAPVGRLKTPKPKCEFDTQMNVRLADPADAAKMQPGKILRLAGQFEVTRQNNKDYLSVTNARVTWADPFNRRAAADQTKSAAAPTPTVVAPNGLPAATPDDQSSTVPSAPAPGQASAPRTRTQTALECLLGVGAPLCRNLFEKRVSAPATYCAKGKVFSDPGDPTGYCPYGPLEAVDYLGTNAAGADVYEVQFRHTDAAYVITPPGPNGKIDRYWVKFGPLNAIMPPSLVRVVSPATDRITLYRRPAQSSDQPDRHAEADQPAPAAALQAPNIAASVQRALAPLPASVASNETVTACRNSSVFGAVLSSKAILLQGFTCFKDQVGSAAPKSVGPQDIALGGCPLASTTDAHKPGCDWDVALNVRLADPADADKMKSGKLVRLSGKFLLTRRQQSSYLTVENAKIQFVDYFWSSRPSFARAAPASGQNLAPFFMPQAPSMQAGNSASGIPFGQIAGIGN
jgi:beta-lactamase regulating signal transducer with metallopeptidase domain